MQNMHDNQVAAVGVKNHFQRDDFRSAWSHNNNGDGVAAGKMITDITGNGFVYVDAHLASTVNPCFRYAYRDMNKYSEMRCSVVLNTAIDATSEGNNTAPYQGAGLIMEDVETGGILSFVLEGRPYGTGAKGNYAILAVQKWTNRASYSSNLVEARIKATGPVDLLAQRDNDTTRFYYSIGDSPYNYFYTAVHSTVGTPYINTNRLGFGYYNSSGTADRGHENASSFGWVDYSPIT